MSIRLPRLRSRIGAPSRRWLGLAVAVATASCVVAAPSAQALNRIQPASFQAPVDSNTAREIPIVYALVAFEGDSTANVSRAELQAAADGASKSVKQFFLASSDKKVSVPPAQVLDWTRVPAPAPSATNCVQRWEYMAEVEAAIELQHPTVNLSNYQHIVLVSPKANYAETPTDFCYVDGLTPPDQASMSWVLTKGNGLIGVAVHETLHAFGLDHGGSLHCRSDGAPSPAGEDCSVGDYGDGSDMISGLDIPLSGAHRLALGMMPMRNLRSEEQRPADGVSVPVTLTSVDKESVTVGTKQVLRIRRPAAVARNAAEPRPYYYLDLRTPVAATLPDGPTDTAWSVYRGIGLKMGAAYKTGDSGPSEIRPLGVNPSVGRGFTEEHGITWNARALFARPGGTGNRPDPDVALKPGQSFYDPLEKYTITATSVGTDTATVTLSAGAPGGAKTTVSMVDDRLTVQAGADRVNGVVVTARPGEIVVSDFGNSVQETSDVCRVVDVQTVACRRNAVGLIDIQTGDRDDTIAIARTVPSSIPSRLDAGSGNDSIEGGDGDDTILGGAAPDGADAIDGGGGTDTVSYAARTGPVTIEPSRNVRPASPYSGLLPRGSGAAGEDDGITRETENLIGGSAADTISVDAADPTERTIDPGRGADTVALGNGPTDLRTLDASAEASIDCRSAQVSWNGDAADTSVGSCGVRSGAPMIDITDAVPAQPVSAVGRAEIRFASTLPGATFECGLDRPGVTASMTPCTSPYVQTGLTQTGAYKFRVWMSVDGDAVAIDDYPFTIERQAPNVSVSAGVLSTPDRTPTATLGNNAPSGGANYECKIDSGEYAGCDASFELPFQSGSSAALTVRAIGRTGVAGTPVTKTYAFTSAVPNATPGSGVTSGAVVKSQSASLAFSGTSGATFTCVIDNRAPQPCTTSISATDLRNGPHQFTVTAKDGAGNVDPTPLRVPFTVDAPVLAITGAASPPTWSTQRKGSFSFSVSGSELTGLTYECRMQTWSACSPGQVFTENRTGLGDSTDRYSYEVRAKRADVEVATAKKQEGLLIDTTAPQVQVPTPVADDVVAASGALFRFSTPSRPQKWCDTGSPYRDQPGSCVRFEAKIDNGTPRTVQSPWSTGPLTPGEHTIEIVAKDLAGNTGTPVSRRIVVGDPRALTLGSFTAASASASLSTDPTLGTALDWIHWKGTTTADLHRRSGDPILPTWAPWLGTSAAKSTVTGSTTFSWSNAAQGPTGQGATGVSVGGASNRGFSLTVPAPSDERRKLKLWLGVRGTTTSGTLSAGLNGETFTNKSFTGTSNSSFDVRTITIDLRGRTPADALTVAWVQSGTNQSASQVALFAAALY